jgi:hydroxyacyl-ACP dehydratase HTD2-like protein with hotdog domain
MAPVNADCIARVFEDVAVGDELTLVRGPLTPVHLMRWSAAIENWHRIHYDQAFAVEHDGLPDLLIQGSWKQQFLVQAVRRWLGINGWLAKISFQFRAMDVVGETLTAWGRVTTTASANNFGIVAYEIGIRNEKMQESTPGAAIGVLPFRDGPPLPRPFPGLPDVD